MEKLIFFLKRLYGFILFSIFSILPLKRKVVFCSYWGLHYSGNPKAVSDCLFINAPDIEQIWVVNKRKDYDVDHGFKTVIWGSISMIYHLATAKVWVDDHNKPGWIRKRKNQFYIQTWHGGLGMKKIEGDILDKLSYQTFKSIEYNAKIIDLYISNSRFFTDIIRRALFYEGEISEWGHPKNDIFFCDEATKTGIRNAFVQRFNIPENKKIILYVPTYRKEAARGKDVLDFTGIIKAFDKRFAGKHVFVVKPHPREKFLFGGIENEDVIIVNNYSTEEMLIACDYVITDYSSTIFANYITGKPGFIFADDLSTYEQERGLYYDIRTLPFPLAENNDEMIGNILTFDEELYKNALKKSTEDFGLKENGQSAKKIVKRITEVV